MISSAATVCLMTELCMILFTFFEQNECIAIANTIIESGRQGTAPYEAFFMYLIKKLFDPAIYQGKNKRENYFEGFFRRLGSGCSRIILVQMM